MPELEDNQEKGGSALAAVLEKKSEKIPYEVEEEERLPGSRIRFKLRLTEEAIKGRLKETFKEFNRHIRIPGFRPGKAPMNLISNRFDREAREETVKRMVPRLAEMLCEEKSIVSISEPYMLDWKSDKNQGTVIELALEVNPDIEINDDTLKDLNVDAYKVTIDDSSIDRAIENMRNRSATFEPSEDAVYASKDGVLVNCTVTGSDGQVIEDRSQDDYYTVNVDNDFPKAIAEALVGKKKGDHIAMDIEDESEGGMKVHYELDVLEIKKRVLPELDDDFAQDIKESYATVADLRAGVRTDLERSEEDRQREEVLKGILKLVSERLEFDLPRALVERTANKNISDMEKRLNQYGMSLQYMEESLVRNYAANVEAQAKANVRNYLIVREISKREDSDPTEAQIQEALERTAERTGRKPLAIRAQLEAKKQWDQFIEDLKLKVTNDKLIDQANVSWKEVSFEEWEKIAEAQRAEQAAALEGRQAGSPADSFQALTEEIAAGAAQGEADAEGESQKGE